MNSILIGVDESERSQDAIALGRRLAEVSNAPIVVGSAFPYNDTPSRAANLSYREQLHDDAEQTAVDMRDRLRIERANIRLVAEPSIAKGLDRIAHSENAALIVVGSTHTGRMGRVAPGSTAERLLHGAPCAVAIAPLGYRENEDQIRTIGVAYDGSSEADAALAAATELARAFGATVELIGVVAPGSYVVPPMMSADGYADLREAAERQMDHALSATVAALPEGVHGRTVRLDGDAAAQLVSHSETLDLLVTGSRGYGPLHAVLAGGVSGRVVREAHCPVIVVPRRADTPLGTLFETSTTAAV